MNVSYVFVGMVAVKRKLSEKRLFESLKSQNSDNNPIVQEDENFNNDDEMVSEPDDESENDTSENLELDNKELYESQNSETFSKNIEEDQNNRSDVRISDSESDSLDLTSLNEPEKDVESDDASSEKMLHN